MAVLRRKVNGRFFIDYVDEGGARRREELFVGRGEQRLAVTRVELAEELFGAFVRERRRLEVARDVDAGQGPRVSKLVDFYVEEYLPAQNAAPKSLSAAMCHLDAFRLYLSEKRMARASQVSGLVVMGFGLWLREWKRGKISDRTVGHYIATVRALFNAAYKMELIPVVPVREWVIPSYEETEVRALSPGELVATLALIEVHDPPLLEVCQWMAWTGQRPSDAVGVCPEHIDLRLGTVERVTVKVKRLRKFKMVPLACDLARRLMEEGAEVGVPLFRFEGRVITVNSLSKRILKVQGRVQFPHRWTAKTFRNTFATIMANEPVGMPLPDLQVAMGHTDIVTTLKYIKPGNGDVARDKFVRLLGGCVSGEESGA